MLENIVRKVLLEEYKPKMILKEQTEISDDLKYHLKNSITLNENIFRIYSDSYFNLINEVRDLYYSGRIDLEDDNDIWLVESNLGESATLDNGKVVWLDAPFEIKENLMEVKHHGKNVRLNSPFRTPGGPKKFAVYVKSKAGKIKKVTFGDPNMRIRASSKARRKSFRARHRCSQKKDRTTAGYWSCRSHRIKSLGTKSKGKYW